MQSPLTCLIIVSSLIVRISLFEFESGDYRDALGPWYDRLCTVGIRDTFQSSFVTYYTPYLLVLKLATLLPLPTLYAIKIFSVASDYILGWFVFRILRLRFSAGPFPILGFALTVFLPTVVLNSALWGQCDSMYSAALVGSIYFAIARNGVPALVAFGFATALKPQALVLGPLLAGLFCSGQIHWKWVWIPPAVYGICGLPAILAGRSVIDTMVHVTKQPPWDRLTLNAPNWYQWLLGTDPSVFFSAGFVFAFGATLLVIGGMQTQMKVTKDFPKSIVVAATVSALVIVYLLPGMHERYFYVADILSLVYPFYWAKRLVVPILVQAASFFSYFPFLFGIEPIPQPLLALLTTAAVLIVACDFAREVLFGSAEQQRK